MAGQKNAARNIILLGLVSALADLSSEIMMPLLPLFIKSLGGAGIAIGLVGGLGDSIASILKVFAGYWSDRLGKRKVFVYWGYGISAFAKLFFPLATAWQHILVLRPAERIGKGLRTAPRDAIIAGYTQQATRGKWFGLHRAMDTGGAVLGSAAAFVLFWYLGLGFREIFAIAAGIAFLALIPLRLVEEPKEEKKEFELKIGLKMLPDKLKYFIGAATVFYLGNFSYMFFVLKSQDIFTGRTAIAAPILLYVLYNMVYAICSTPAGMLSDRIGRKRTIVLGYSAFALTAAGFALFDSLYGFVVLFALYGLTSALIEGTQAAYVSDLSPKEYRGTALGTYHTMTGLAMLPAGLIAGALWQYIGAWATFYYGAGMALIAGFLIIGRKT